MELEKYEHAFYFLKGLIEGQKDTAQHIETINVLTKIINIMESLERGN